MALGRVSVDARGNLRPAGGGTGPSTYSAAYGGIPGPTPVPPSTYEQTRSIYPQIQNLTGGAGKVIQSQLSGELSPETINAIQNAAASWGVATGMPGSQFAGYRGLRQLGLNVEQMQNQGVGNYNNFLGSIARTTNDPALLAQISAYNNQLAAAPDPAAAAAAAEKAYQDAIRQTQGTGTIPSVGGISSSLPSFGGSRPAGSAFTPGAYEAPPVVGSPAAGTGGLTYGGATYYGGTGPTQAANNWQTWASSLPGMGTAPAGSGTFYAGEPLTWQDVTSPGVPGGSWQNVADIGLGNFMQAGGGLDFGAMYNEAGLPYTDWSNPALNIDWSIYE